MPTTYPGTIDALSNPSAGSYTPNPSHVGQHTDANDAIEAIETELGTTPSGAAATVAARFTADEAGLAAHLADTADAHDASAISILDTAADFTATDVEGALAELQSDAEAHLADASAAHAASAISYAGGTGISATDVEAAIDELATEKADKPQAASATRTSADYTTTSTTFVDVDATNLALTITTAARRVLIGVTATGFHATSATDIYLDVMLDGARLGQTGGLVGNTCITGSSTIHNFSFTHLTAALTAASHTFKLQWRVGAATTGTLRASTGNQPLHFYVIEQGV